MHKKNIVLLFTFVVLFKTQPRLKALFDYFVCKRVTCQHPVNLEFFSFPCAFVVFKSVSTKYVGWFESATV